MRAISPNVASPFHSPGNALLVRLALVFAQVRSMESPPTEVSSWERIRAGDEAELRVLEKRVMGILGQWAVDAETRAGACQDVLSKVWEEASGGREEPRNLSGYLWNKSRGALKTAWRRRVAAQPFEGVQEPVAPEGRSNLELRDALRDCHRTIPDENVRRAWHLRHEDEPARKAREVAEILGVPLGTVTFWWDRARRHVHKCMERKGWVA